MHLLLTVFALLPAIATLSAATSLQPRADTCPDNQSNVNINNKHYCCPGSVISAGNDDGYCCVDGDVAVPTVSFCSGFPFCSSTGTATAKATKTSSTSASCRTTIPFSATDYSSLVSKAAKSTGGAGNTSGGSGASSKTSSGGAGMPLMTGGPETWVGVGIAGAMGVLGAL